MFCADVLKCNALDLASLIRSGNKFIVLQVRLESQLEDGNWSWETLSESKAKLVSLELLSWIAHLNAAGRRRGGVGWASQPCITWTCTSLIGPNFFSSKFAFIPYHKWFVFTFLKAMNLWFHSDSHSFRSSGTLRCEACSSYLQTSVLQHPYYILIGYHHNLGFEKTFYSVNGPQLTQDPQEVWEACFGLASNQIFLKRGWLMLNWMESGDRLKGVVTGVPKPWLRLLCPWSSMFFPLLYYLYFILSWFSTFWWYL